MACCTLCRVSSATISGRLSTFDTVPSETPARFATSRIPDIGLIRAGFLISPIEVLAGLFGVPELQTLPDVLATRTRVALMEVCAGVAAQQPRQHTPPPLQQGAALQVPWEQQDHQNALEVSSVPLDNVKISIYTCTY